MVLVYIIASIFAIVMISLFLKGGVDEYDKRMEDEDQMRWIQEFNKKRDESMTRDEARDILIAYVSCNIATKDNKLCEKCPYYEDEKCENSLFTTEGMMVEAINIMREV